MFDLKGKAAASSGRVLQGDGNKIADQSVCVRTSFFERTGFDSALSQVAGTKCRFSGRHFPRSLLSDTKGN